MSPGAIGRLGIGVLLALRMPVGIAALNSPDAALVALVLPNSMSG